MELAAAEGVDLDGDFLTGTHSCELSLLEVGGDPEVRQRDDGEEILPDAEVGAYLHVLFVDDSGGGGGDVGVAEVECGLINLGLGLLDVSHGGVRFGLLGADLIGAGLDRLGRLIARLREFLKGLGDLGLAGDLVGFGLEDGGLVGGIGCNRGVILLLGDDVLLDERGVALDVQTGFDGVGLGGGDAGFGSLLLLAGLIDGSGGGLDVGAGGVDAGGDVDIGNRHVNRLLDCRRLCAGEVRLCLL